jgi:hypothetical protein
MVYCARSRNAELVIVTRDSDYGIEYDGQAYVNDHLKQEFAERVSQKRKLLLYRRLSDALKHFKVAVTPQEEQAESEIVAQEVIELPRPSATEERLRGLRLIFEEFSQRMSAARKPPEIPAGN